MLYYFRPNLISLGELNFNFSREDISREPSLSLCDLDTFTQLCGPVSFDILKTLRQLPLVKNVEDFSASQEIYKSNYTTRAMYIKTGEAPHFPLRWHVDASARVIGIDEGTQKAVLGTDYADNLSFPSIISLAIFLPDQGEAASLPTEYLLDPLYLELESLVCPSHIFYKEAEKQISRLEAPTIFSPQNREVIAFTPHTFHRPARALVPGWRFFFRIALMIRDDLAPFRNCLHEYLYLTGSNGEEVHRKIDGITEDDSAKLSHSWHQEREACERVISENRLRVLAPRKRNARISGDAPA